MKKKKFIVVLLSCLVFANTTMAGTLVVCKLPKGQLRARTDKCSKHEVEVVRVFSSWDRAFMVCNGGVIRECDLNSQKR